MDSQQTLQLIDEIIIILNNRDDRIESINEELSNPPMLSDNGLYHNLMNLTIHQIIPLINTWRNNWVNEIDPKLNQIVKTTEAIMLNNSHTWVENLMNSIGGSYNSVKLEFTKIVNIMNKIDNDVKSLLMGLKSKLEIDNTVEGRLCRLERMFEQPSSYGKNMEERMAALERMVTTLLDRTRPAGLD